MIIITPIHLHNSIVLKKVRYLCDRDFFYSRKERESITYIFFFCALSELANLQSLI
jgi:hypothetical protein